MGTFAFLVVLGKHTPFYRVVYEHVPGMGFFRLSQRYLCVFELVLVVFAAHGFDLVRAKWKHRRAHALIVVVALADAYGLNAGQNSTYSASAWMRPPATVEFLRQHPGAIVYTPFSTPLHRHVFQLTSGVDPEPYFALRGLLQPDLNALWGIRSAGGHAGTGPTWSIAVSQVGMWHDQVWNEVLNNPRVRQTPSHLTLSDAIKISAAQGVDFVLLGTERPDLEALTLGHSELDGIHVYALPGVPDAYLATHAGIDTSGDNRRLIVLDSNYRLGESVVLHESMERLREVMRAQHTAAAERVPSTLTWRARRPSYHSWLVQSQGQWLVDIDTYTPDWQAMVDGRSSTLVRANTRQRAVFVPPGQHTVEMVLRPAAMWWGRGLSIGGLLLVVLMLAGLHVAKPKLAA